MNHDFRGLSRRIGIGPVCFVPMPNTNPLAIYRQFLYPGFMDTVDSQSQTCQGGGYARKTDDRRQRTEDRAEKTQDRLLTSVFCLPTSVYTILAPRAYSVLMFAALFCTLAVKFIHSWRYDRTVEYFSWILADVSVLLGLEVILAMVCFRWPRRACLRTCVVIAGIVCTWSVMNAAWLIRTGTQILPAELLPLFRDPLNSLGIVAVNLVKMPGAAVVLLGPSAVALSFLLLVLARPVDPNYHYRRLAGRIIISVIVVLAAAAARGTAAGRGSAHLASVGLRFNCQAAAIMSFLQPGFGHLARDDFAEAARTIPAFDQVDPALTARQVGHNVVLVVLEGIQYSFTSLSGNSGQALTPYLGGLARSGVEFTNARSTVTHTTKALFALLTGRFPSVVQDIAETVPTPKHYASIATVLKDRLGFRTAFFQSAKGNFESRPGLVYNLGFDKFWARDDLGDANSFLGYLACDEFSMLEPITEWIRSCGKPFFLTVLCSVAHDPYEVPKWFAEPAKEPVDRYRQAIFYTDKFLAALDVELANLGLADKTVLCVIADHGEAFGEHGLLGHERIAFDEVLRVPWVIRAPFLTESGSRVTEPVSSVDVTPTLLSLLGFDTSTADFDGVNALGDIPENRKVYFSGWMQQGPAGFVKGDRKFIYNPTNKTVSVYDLRARPLESQRGQLSELQARQTTDDIIAWRRNSIFRIDQPRPVGGKKMLFDRWLCNSAGRTCSVKYQKSE